MIALDPFDIAIEGIWIDPLLDILFGFSEPEIKMETIEVTPKSTGRMATSAARFLGLKYQKTRRVYR